MTREFIIQEFTKRGITAEPMETYKNGVKVQGVVFGDGDTRPAIYEYDYQHYTDDEINDLFDAMQEYLNMPSKPKDLEDILSWEHAKSHLRLCVQRQGQEDLIKRPFTDLDLYVRAMYDFGSVKVTPDVLKGYGVTEEELFQAAWENCQNDIVITPIEEMLQELSQSLSQPMPELPDAAPMFVLSNRQRHFGAFAMGVPEVLESLANQLDSDLIIIPSSIHECIVIPAFEDYDHEYLNDLVQFINETSVSFEERLQDHIYFYDKDTKTLEIKNNSPSMTM